MPVVSFGWYRNVARACVTCPVRVVVAAWFNYGLLLERRNSFSEAKEAYERCLGLANNNPSKCQLYGATAVM